MKTLKIHNLSKSYGDKLLFQNLNLTINEGERVGLIGVNGTGKSHLMKIITDSSLADSGEITHPQQYEIGYLAQETTFAEDLTISEIIFQGDSPIFQAIRKYERALQRLENDNSSAAQEAFHQAELLMEKEQAWNAEIDAQIILNKLGLPKPQVHFKELSGGQQKRVGLAQVLIQAPDLLLLDEPTNHLDYEAISWLEDYLSHYQGALLVITHDRYFLDRVANRIVELENGILTEYQGNYENYLEQKATLEEQKQVKLQKQKQLYKQELAWMRAGVQARGTKQQARQDRFYDLENNLKQQGQKQEQLTPLEFEQQRLGRKVLNIEHGYYKFENQVFLNDFNCLIQRHDRIGILGHNGSGKTTLLNILAGLTPLTEGTLTIGETVKIGYYRQQNTQLDDNKRMINYLQEIADVVKYENKQISISELLERFLFPRSMHGTLIGRLSGGEKRRLYLLSILIQQPNVLLLDEPTNDLDIATLTILEDYLKKFDGAVIVVSHDRYFLDKVVEQLWILNSGNIETYLGLASEYLIKQQEKNISKTDVKVKEKEVKKTKPKTEKIKLTYQEQKEWENIEKEIDNLDDKINSIKEEMLSCGSDYVKLGDLQKDMEILDQKLNDKLERYEYLSQYV